MIPACCESFVRKDGRRGGAGFEGGRAKSSIRVVGRSAGIGSEKVGDSGGGTGEVGGEVMVAVEGSKMEFEKENADEVTCSGFGALWRLR